MREKEKEKRRERERERAREREREKERERERKKEKEGEREKEKKKESPPPPQLQLALLVWYVEYGALAAFLFAGSTGTTSGREMWIRGCAKITFKSITTCWKLVKTKRRISKFIRLLTAIASI